MKDIAYALLQRYIRFGFFCYYQRLQMDGIAQLSREVPTLVLPNHQNALLDPLLIAAYAPKPPYFLTRSDVFQGPRLKAFFRFLRMMPIYRIRDGRETLGRNQAVFRNCATILAGKQSIVMFPEANHNLGRRVRPLSKGFTRILFEAMEVHPGLPLEILPVGLNYQKGDGFPDRVRFIFGEPIAVADYVQEGDEREQVLQLRDAVSNALYKLTTHIDHPQYDTIISALEEDRVDFTDPEAVNKRWPHCIDHMPDHGNRPKKNAADVAIEILNAPVVLAWRQWLKPKVPEAEFTATYRFGFALLAYPVFYLLLLGLLGITLGLLPAMAIVLTHFFTNLIYVKIR